MFVKLAPYPVFFLQEDNIVKIKDCIKPFRAILLKYVYVSVSAEDITRIITYVDNLPEGSTWRVI